MCKVHISRRIVAVRVLLFPHQLGLMYAQTGVKHVVLTMGSQGAALCTLSSCGRQIVLHREARHERSPAGSNSVLSMMCRLWQGKHWKVKKMSHLSFCCRKYSQLLMTCCSDVNFSLFKQGPLGQSYDLLSCGEMCPTWTRCDSLFAIGASSVTFFHCECMFPTY